MAIKSFKNKASQEIAIGTSSKSARRLLPAKLHALARKKLFILHSAVELNDLRLPPSNSLEKLVGNRIGQYSIRINSQYCICFYWEAGFAVMVEIVDYH